MLLDLHKARTSCLLTDKSKQDGTSSIYYYYTFILETVLINPSTSA